MTARLNVGGAVFTTTAQPLRTRGRPRGLFKPKAEAPPSPRPIIFVKNRTRFSSLSIRRRASIAASARRSCANVLPTPPTPTIPTFMSLNSGAVAPRSRDPCLSRLGRFFGTDQLEAERSILWIDRPRAFHSANTDAGPSDSAGYVPADRSGPRSVGAVPIDAATPVR